MGLRNDLGLLAEEYDAVAGRMVGNFPQAFSHVSLVNSAAKLMGQEKPSSEHVILGLARRALTRGKSSPVQRHLGGISAQTIVTTLAENAGRGNQRSAANLLKNAVSSTSGTPPGLLGTTSRGEPGAAAERAATRRGRPTTRPTAKKATPLATKAPIKAVGTSRRASGSAAKPAAAAKILAKKMAASRTAPAKKAPAKKAPAKKATAKKAPAKKATAKTAKKATAKRAPAKKATAKKAPAKKAPAKKATNATRGR
jgi:hypothetical protein